MEVIKVPFDKAVFWYFPENSVEST